MVPVAAVAPIVFALGCVVGSFLNVCIYRMPRDRSVVAPPSHCPQCGVRLTAFDLVPLLSFLALGRKCRRCGGPIAWRYFLVELLTGIVFVLIWAAYPWQPAVLPAWAFGAIVIAVVFTDLDHMIIPDQLVVAGVVAALLSEGIAFGAGQWQPVHLPGLATPLPRVLLGGVLGGLVFVGIRAFSQLLFRREGMGLGDVKLAVAIGAMLGPGLALLSFGLAVAAGAVLGVFLILLRLRRRMEYLPFGPFLAAAALVALVAPQGLLGSARSLYETWLRLSGM